MTPLYSIPGCRVEQVTRHGPTHAVVSARTEREGARCPSCHRRSTSPNGTYVRRPADLPSAERSVQLELRVRRFYCRNPECTRRTFAEQFPRLLPVRARRTRRLAAAQCAVSMTTGAEAGARVLARLAMPTSPDTLLRLVRRAPLPSAKNPRVLGVDDWALRKGRTYGSILVDLEAHHIVDLLPDRSAPTLAAWLRQHSGVKILTRDRSTEYARAAAEGAPKVQQVADRWHLLLNVRQMLERWLTSAHARLRALPCPPSVHPPAPGRTASFPRTRSEAAARKQSRARRQAAYKQVRRLHRAGQSLLAISRTLHLARGTVRKYASAHTFPERAVRAPGPSILDPYLEYLSARHAEGCENAMVLWREIRAKGYPGTSRQVLRWMQMRRVDPAPSTPGPYRRSSLRHREAHPSALPSPKQLAWLCVQPPSALAATDKASVVRIEQDEEAARVITLTRRFSEIVRQRSVMHGAKPLKSCRPFEAWLRQAQSCGVRVVETFAAGLQQDGDAVRAALTTSWSNAQAEGQITKLKLLKRQMYGRAGFELLRRRALLAA